MWQTYTCMRKLVWVAHVMASRTHVQRVRILYKTILRLHRGLPVEIQPLGNDYVRDEFRRHKKCVESEAITFLQEWTVSTYKVDNTSIIERALDEFWRLCSTSSSIVDRAVRERNARDSRLTECNIYFLSIELRGFSRQATRVERSSHGKTAGQTS